MRRGWIAVAIVVAVFIGLGAYFASTNDDDGWGRGDHNEVQTIQHSDGTTETITIERDGRGFPGFFFFPFGFFLVVFLFFGLMRFAFGGSRGGPWRGGPGGDGGPMRDRFTQWHREEHEKMAEHS